MRRSLLVAFLGLNFVCAVVALHASQKVGSGMAVEHRTTGDVGDGLAFLAIAWPALIVALVPNLAWLGMSLVDASRRQSYKALKWFGITVVFWGVVMSLVWRA